MVLVAVVLWKMASASSQTAREQEPSFSEFMAQVDKGNVKEVTLYISQNSYEVQGEVREPAGKFRSTIPKEAFADVQKTLREKGVPIRI